MAVIVEIATFSHGLSQQQNRDGRGWGIDISLDAIFEGIHISLVIFVRGYTYHGDTHITVTPGYIYIFIQL